MTGTAGTTKLHALVPAELDVTDQAIIEALQQDGRTSISNIARKIGLSHAGTTQRLQRLLRSNIVAINAITNPTTHGFSRRTALLVRTGANSRAVGETIAAIDEVYYVALTSGRYDLMVEILARDDRHLEQLITAVREIPGVVGAEALPFLDIVKWEYAPGFA